MTRHLDEQQLSAVIVGLELEAAAQEHLESCLACRSEVAHMEELLTVRGRQLSADEPDWEAQRAAILDRLPPTPRVLASRRRVWLRPLLAMAAVIFIALGLVVLWQGSPVSQSATADVEDAQAEAILAEVDALLADDSLPGFEPLQGVVPSNDEFQDYFTNGAS